MVLGVTFYVGALISLIAGVGVFLEDVRPGVDIFWRSRPILVNQWFWTIYLTALGVTLGFLAIPCLPAAGWISGQCFRNPNDRIFDLIMISLLINGFAAAAAAMALLRRPLMASVMPLGLLGVCGGALALYDHYGGNRLEAVAGVLIVLLTIGLPVLAWQAVKRDWGWKADQ